MYAIGNDHVAFGPGIAAAPAPQADACPGGDVVLRGTAAASRERPSPRALTEEEPLSDLETVRLPRTVGGLCSLERTPPSPLRRRFDPFQ